ERNRPAMVFGERGMPEEPVEEKLFDRLGKTGRQRLQAQLPDRGATDPIDVVVRERRRLGERRDVDQIAGIALGVRGVRHVGDSWIRALEAEPIEGLDADALQRSSPREE